VAASNGKVRCKRQRVHPRLCCCKQHTHLSLHLRLLVTTECRGGMYPDQTKVVWCTSCWRC
jgi:hypothetical protein